MKEPILSKYIIRYDGKLIDTVFLESKKAVTNYIRTFYLPEKDEFNPEKKRYCLNKFKIIKK